MILLTQNLWNIFITIKLLIYFHQLKTLTYHFKAFWLVNVLLKALSKTDQSKFPDTYKTQVIVRTNHGEFSKF